MSVVHAVAGPARAGVARTCAARSRSSAGSPARTLGDAHGRRRGRSSSDDYDAHPRPHRARSSPASTTSTERVREPRRLRPAEPAARRARFPTADGQGAAHASTSSRWCACPPGRLLLQTVRSHDQYNTTIYGLDDRYRGIHQRPPGGVREPRRPGRRSASPTATLVDLVGECDGQRAAGAEASGSSPTRPPAGCCAAYFPEANVLVPLDSTAEVSNTPTSKSIVVRLEPIS